MNIFKYFDSLLSGKHSLLALKYSDSVEESLRKAYASKCAIEARSKVARDESFKECAICEHTFSEEYLTQVKLWMGKDKIVCRRCLLKNEKTICEKCGKAIASDDFLIYVLCPVLDFHYIEKAKEFFHDKNVSSAKVALDPIEFEDLCNNLGGSEYAKDFGYGKIICNECYEKINFDKTLNTVIRRELYKLDCEFRFPAVRDLRAGIFDNSGISKDIYLDKIDKNIEKNLAKLHELDTQLLEALGSYPHYRMENGLDRRQRIKFYDARYISNINTALPTAKKMLSEGVKNSVEEFLFALSSKLDITNEDNIVIECNPTNQGCDVIVIVPTENTLDESIIKKLFQRHVIDKPIEHPYGMPWQRTKNKATLSYEPSLSLENIDIDESEGNIVIVARIEFKFE